MKPSTIRTWVAKCSLCSTHDVRAGSFLERPVLDCVPDLIVDEGLAPGALIGWYTILREIGRGGMGVVYLANDERLGRVVAIKALASHLMRDESHRERLRREARAAAGLTHPGICTVYALEEIDGEVYLVTEFVDGCTLREEMGANGRPAAKQVLDAARELASALAAAHERGITHRDVKPENIMRTSDGRLEILDFGLARLDGGPTLPGGITQPGLLVGTPAYMAPEQLKAQSADRRADVFALGVLLYEYATGAHPFAASAPMAAMARALDGDVAPVTEKRPDLPAALATAIMRCLRPLPADRFQAATDIVVALESSGEARPAGAGIGWWRVHQCVIIALYVAAAAAGWELKEWLQLPTATTIFMALGIGATIGGVLRGHMLFTERVNWTQLRGERRRFAPAILIVDVALAAALTIDALMFVAQPLSSLLTISLAIGIVLAAAVVEPATVRAAFGEEQNPI